MPLYALGSNGSGQLGVGSMNDVVVPKVCPLPESLPGAPKKIAAGGNHTLLLVDDGTIYCAGRPSDGKVRSNPPLASSKTFQKTYFSESGKKAKLCSSWWDGSLFVDSHDTVHTAGSGRKGEQGTGESPASIEVQAIPNFPPQGDKERGEIVDIDGSVDHIVVVLAEGTAYGWGNGRKGQLTGTRDVAWAPRKIENSEQLVARAVCGREFTFLIHRDGTHAVLGTTKWDLQDACLERTSDWKDISASWGSIFILKENGKLESWGRNDHGQLAPRGLPDIEQLAVGSEHVVALTKDNEVISWGWGEHGNCGIDIDENGDVKGRWNVIPVDPSERVLGVGAGCATSFFWTRSSSTKTENANTNQT